MERLRQETLHLASARDRPLDCAGAYKLEAGGIALFGAIACDDHSAITGLPLLPPMMSSVEMKFIGVLGSSFALASSQRCGSFSGSVFVAWAKRPPYVVAHGVVARWTIREWNEALAP